MYVIGTAGHVDHGKSALIEALTGIHPDRLQEERERGLTIELGFAWMTLPSGREVSIVDVPGHVRFVRHMLAGIGAIDLALFVVAADEGVMPQTREHLEILDLLDVRHAVVALTKVDLAPDEEWLELVEEELREQLAPTTLGGAPIVRTSAATGEGLDALRAALDAALADTPEPRDVGRPRFGIDRVFTMQGFGTVVTGTLLDGTLRAGETLEAVPGGPSARIRGLQTHQQQVDEAQPGTRVAINLAGVGTDELRRGQVLAPPGQVGVARTVDAMLRVLPERALRHNLRVTVHLGAAETQGRLRVLGADEVAAGSEGWCQIQLAPPIAATPGDLFVVRVSDRTLGGGRVLAVNTPRHRRTDPAAVERLRALAAGSPDEAVLASLERVEPATLAELARHADAEGDALAGSIEALVERGDVMALDGAETRYVSAAGAARLRTRAERALEAYEREHPLRRVMSGEELRARLGLDAGVLDAVLPALAPDVVADAGGVRRAEWSPQPTAAQRRAAEEAVATLAAGGVSPPRIDLDPELAAFLEDRGEIVDCGDGVMLSAAAFEEVSRTVVALIEAQGSATLAQLRDAIGTNRRATQAMLERLDRDGVTRRRGDERVLARTPA
ncbi:MAG: selenocysteine-specific translation elongation factor [Chloroflexota bacterium]|nr:selenocysteine-specific translation elongation factor [Chloroflexota bacterium]